MSDKQKEAWKHSNHWWENQKRDYEARQLAYADETDEERDAREAKETREDIEKNG